MQPTPAFHAHTLETTPDAALAPAAGAMGCGCVEAVEPLPLVPCPAEFDVNEKREYGGVEASFLAWAAPELLRRKWDIGVGAIHHALWKFTTKVQNALFTYSRVKRAMRWLETPQEVSVFIDDTPKPDSSRRKPVAPARRPAFKWAVTPKDTYQWEACVTRYGFDARGTSVDWIERQVREARAKARNKAVRDFREREGLTSPTPKTRDASEPARIDTKTFEPAPAQFGEIWPPVPVPDMASAPVTVTPDYASAREAEIKADPNEAVIGVMYIENDTNRGDFRNDGTWWELKEQYAVTERGLVYAPNAVLKPP